LAHAHLLEFGTSRQPAQPYMRPAWDSTKQAVLENIRAALWAEILRRAK
jgi:HK97 gp10 family phage protein